MWTPWRNKTGLTMVTVILATALCLSIASCGLNYELIIATSDFQWATGVLTVTAYAESALMVGSAIGLMIMPLVWLICKLSRKNEAGGERGHGVGNG